MCLTDEFCAAEGPSFLSDHLLEEKLLCFWLTQPLVDAAGLPILLEGGRSSAELVTREERPSGRGRECWTPTVGGGAAPRGEVEALLRRPGVLNWTFLRARSWSQAAERQLDGGISVSLSKIKGGRPSRSEAPLDLGDGPPLAP